MKLAVIPARGGSVRIPRKNIKCFGGRPMIAWSISAALNSDLFDRVIVSTDDPEIAQISMNEGAETPFTRPTELSDHMTGTIPVIAHAVDWQNTNGAQTTEVCCIYATAPFIEIDDLRRGFNILKESGADFAFSVTSYSSPIQRALKMGEDRRIEMFNPENFNKRSQDLEEAWHDAGQFYWGLGEAWLSGKPLFGSHSAAVPLPRHRVQDIDTPDDWDHAEMMFKAKVKT